ncbi:MAG TPA: phosphoesterase [Anaeromyxobacteraceae bacterium]|nr:phosphoesterase [Anaeromyxobacteraceae bacterium]
MRRNAWVLLGGPPEAPGGLAGPPPRSRREVDLSLVRSLDWPAPMLLKVLYHGNCFDGCVSAALFSRFFAEHEGKDTITAFQPLQHKDGDPFPPGAFDGDVNACVDFRFSPSPDLHWWFDHHASAFQPASDRAYFESDRSGRKFWDPTAPSCAGLIARTLEARFGWSAPDRADLLRWADVIDAARFPSAAMAVRLEEPALRIMALVEATRDPALPTRLIEALRFGDLHQIASERFVADPLAPILERHFSSTERMRQLARLRGGVVEIDLSESGIEGASKFIAYDLFPQARYAVVISVDAKRSKVSVGSNPWSTTRREHDISKICEKYGGGGHPAVGAVSLDPDRLLDARRIAREIAEMLREEHT